jgi:hypothetical protein
MSESIVVTSARTEDLNAATRASIIQVCIMAHRKDDFMHLFSYIPSGGIHILAYRKRFAPLQSEFTCCIFVSGEPAIVGNTDRPLRQLSPLAAAQVLQYA